MIAASGSAETMIAGRPEGPPAIFFIRSKPHGPYGCGCQPPEQAVGQEVGHFGTQQLELIGIRFDRLEAQPEVAKTAPISAIINHRRTTIKTPAHTSTSDRRLSARNGRPRPRAQSERPTQRSIAEKKTAQGNRPSSLLKDYAPLPSEVNNHPNANRLFAPRFAHSYRQCQSYRFSGAQPPRPRTPALPPPTTPSGVTSSNRPRNAELLMPFKCQFVE